MTEDARSTWPLQCGNILPGAVQLNCNGLVDHMVFYGGGSDTREAVISPFVDNLTKRPSFQKKFSQVVKPRPHTPTLTPNNMEANAKLKELTHVMTSSPSTSGATTRYSNHLCCHDSRPSVFVPLGIVVGHEADSHVGTHAVPRGLKRLLESAC